ncbi:hypothetical protein L9F63_024907, partial [Diploptera punctata]
DDYTATIQLLTCIRIDYTTLYKSSNCVNLLIVVMMLKKKWMLHLEEKKHPFFLGTNIIKYMRIKYMSNDEKKHRLLQALQQGGMCDVIPIYIQSKWATGRGFQGISHHCVRRKYARQLHSMRLQGERRRIRHEKIKSALEIEHIKKKQMLELKSLTLRINNEKGRHKKEMENLSN